MLLFVATFMTSGQPAIKSLSSLKFLSEYEVPFNKAFMNTKIGGLSGIDYDSANQVYYVISDDRSGFNPVRYYTVKVILSGNGIDSVQFIGMNFLLQENGNTFPNSKTDAQLTPDPESIRYNPVTHQLIWTSEGERGKRQDHFVLQNPAINISDRDGKNKGTFPVAKNLQMTESEIGPRQNGALEGLTFADHYKVLYASMEEPLHEDGPRADLSNNSPIRIYKYDVREKKIAAQYAYALESVARAPVPATAFKVNGISEILSFGKDKLLVMERSFSTGRLACSVKIFKADLQLATDVSSVASLADPSPIKFAKKELLLDMDSLDRYIDNIEGMTFGPRLSNGHQTLIFISDNNFVPLEKTQFLLFEVIP